jgi:hypothetical protein
LDRGYADVDFGEPRTCEVRRIPIPRTSVNKGMKKGRGVAAPALLAAELT